MSLKIPTQKIYGRIIPINEKQSAVIFHPHSAKAVPPPSEFQPLYLRYALTQLGTERPILPSFILDDWGGEIRKLEMYRWVQIEGDRFPRAEAFGYILNFNQEWEKSQFFMRDLELSARHPLYVYTSKDDPIDSGQRVHALVKASSDIDKWEPSNGKSFKLPLKRAQVKWWQMPLSDAILPTPPLKI